MVAPYATGGHPRKPDISQRRQHGALAVAVVRHEQRRFHSYMHLYNINIYYNVLYKCTHMHYKCTIFIMYFHYCTIMYDLIMHNVLRMYYLTIIFLISYSTFHSTHKNCNSLLYTHVYYYIMIVGLEHGFYFPYIGNVIIPTDELIFFRGVGIPPTRYRWVSVGVDLPRL
jgi:hypothetical protein